MRYHIDTIPVWDAIKLHGECLFCALHRKVELTEVQRMLGASVMDPDSRIRFNALGCCQEHHRMLYAMDNRVGHALLLESHMAEVRKSLLKHSKSINASASAYSSAPLGKLSRRGSSALQDFLKQCDALNQELKSCALCKSVNENMDRYVQTFFYLYQNDTEFRRQFQSSKGVCLPHMTLLLQAAPDELPAHDIGSFVSQLLNLVSENLDRTQEDISWFIKKFDYRYSAEPWKESKDAVPRSVNKLRGWCVGEEPNPKK